MSIGDNIKHKRLLKGYTLEELARKVETSRQTIQRYESGVILNIPSDKIEKIAIALDTTPAYLMGWEDEKTFVSPKVTDDVVTFPVIGEIAAGYDSIAVEDWTGETVDIPRAMLKGRKESEYFVLTVKGDSMYPHYQNNDKVLILKQSTLDHSGEVGAVLYEGECATLKKVEYKEGEDWLKLIPINPEFMPKLIEGSDLEQCRIIGKPTYLIRDLNNI